MADERLRNKSELKRLFTNLRNKNITDEMMSIAIDSLWRDKLVQRTSGFEFPAHFDSEISFDTNTRIFSIQPWDPQVEGFLPRYGIYSYLNHPIFHRHFEPFEIEIPNEEGLFCVYFDNEPAPGNSLILFYKKNPTAPELQTIYTSNVLVSFLYCDAENSDLLHFGDDRHGSEWNPQLHWYLNKSFAARCKTGLQIVDYVINADGSNNNHAQFLITSGTILHDDIELEIPESQLTIPILYFTTNLFPRFVTNPGYSVLKGSNQLCYNGPTGLTEAASDKYVIYHYFATNEIQNTSRKIISVMGSSEYTSIGAAYSGCQTELNNIKNLLPMQGRYYIDSAIFQTSNEYTNSIKARIIGFVSSLWPETNEYITEMLQGDIDGSNTLFTTSKPFASGKITVLLNGLKEYHFSEINETTVEMDSPPKNTGFTDIIESIYKIK